MFSSGTTGLPKAVGTPTARWAPAPGHWVTALGLTADDRFQVATPPSHILGLLNLLAAAEAGATVRLHGRFDLDEVLRRIESDRMTLEMAVAPIALAIAGHPNLEDLDLSSLRYIMWGATPVTASVAEAVTARTGVRWLPAYGASELPVIACNPVDRPDEWRLDSAGLPGPEVELRVVDLDTGAVLAPGEVGEIQARSPSLMTGYLPESANDDAFVDGWYRTGDVGWLEPEGWVHLTDRSKEMIKVKASRWRRPRWRPCCTATPPCVDCAVFGIPDERPARCRWPRCSSTPTHRSTPPSSSSSSPTPSPPTSSSATSSSSTPSPGSPRARCCAAPSATPGRRSSPTPARRLMDVRLSPEQRRPARLGRAARRPPRPDDGRRPRRRGAPAKLDAAVDAAGWRELRTGTDDGDARGRRRSRSPSWPRSWPRGLADAPFLGPDPRRRPPPSSRRPAGHRAARPSRSTADLAALAAAADGPVPAARRRRRRRRDQRAGARCRRRRRQRRSAPSTLPAAEVRGSTSPGRWPPIAPGATP